MEAPNNILEVKLGGDFYAFDGDKVEQILRVPSITPVPLSNENVRGVSSISGKIITIVDMGIIFGGESIDVKNTNARILTMQYNGAVYGVLVDEVLVMTNIDQKNYESVENEGEKIAGFYKQNEIIYQIIDHNVCISTLNLMNFQALQVDSTQHTTSGVLDNESSKISDETKRYLFLTLEDETFAVTLEVTREIIFVPSHVTPVKEAGYGVMGVITLRDELITAIDLRMVLGFNKAQKTNESRFLILNHKGKSLALLVDSIQEVKDVQMNLVEPLPSRFSQSKLEAIYKAKEGITSLIDKEYLISLIDEYYIEDNQINNVQNDQEKHQQLQELDANEIAVFSINNEEFALPIEDLQEIIKYTTVTPVPEAPDFIDGVINLRGVVIPIFSLPQRLGFAKQISASSKILVCSFKGERLGLLVDDVNEILFVENKYISQSDSEDVLFSEVISLNNGSRVILKIRTSALVDKHTLDQVRLINKEHNGNENL